MCCRRGEREAGCSQSAYGESEGGDGGRESVCSSGERNGERGREGEPKVGQNHAAATEAEGRTRMQGYQRASSG